MSTTSNLEQFVRQHGEELLRLAFTYVKQRQTSEDIVQDVLLKAFEKQHEFRGDSEYRTYLYRMTINKCMDYLRSWHYRKTTVTETFRTRIGYMQSSDSTEDSQILGRQILELPIKYREILVLYYYKELSVKEISHLLNLSENTVKTRLQRGRFQLKSMLERGGYDARYFYQNEY